MSENKFTYTHRDFKILTLESKDLKELFNLVYEFCQNIKITVSCINNTTSELNSIDDLINYKNKSSREVCEISFKGYNSQCNPNRYIALIIENANIVSSTNLYIDIEGPERDVNQLKYNINDSISNMKASGLYRVLRRASSISNIFIISITLYVLAKLQIMSNFTFPLFFIFLFFLVFIMVADIFVDDKFNRIKRKYFPTVIFAIGHGEKRYKSKKHIISVITTNVIIPILLYYLLSLLNN